MTSNDILQWLEDEIDNYPDRTSGEDSHRFIVKQAGKVLPNDRNALVAALRIWLSHYSTSKEAVRVDLAIEISATYNLIELKPDIELLLKKVENGKGLKLKPYYAARIRKLMNEFK